MECMVEVMNGNEGVKKRIEGIVSVSFVQLCDKESFATPISSSLIPPYMQTTSKRKTCLP